jgi:hypothetical protein
VSKSATTNYLLAQACYMPNSLLVIEEIARQSTEKGHLEAVTISQWGREDWTGMSKHLPVKYVRIFIGSIGEESDQYKIAKEEDPAQKEGPGEE